MSHIHTKEITVVATLLAITTTGCNPLQIATETATLIQALTAQKQMVEQIAQDVKRQIQASDETSSNRMPRQIQAPSQTQASDDNAKNLELDYFAAREAMNGYLNAVQMAVRARASANSLDNTARRAQEQISRFCEDAVKVLEPTLDTRGLRFERAVNIPTNLHAAIARAPHKYQAVATRQMESLRLKAWRDL